MTNRVVVRVLCASLLALVPMITSRAQAPPQNPAQVQRGIDPDFEQRQRDLRLVDKLITARETPKNTTTKRRDPKVVAAELQEDFEHIQIVNNDLAQAASNSGPLNLEFVVKSSADLVQHSKRLQENLGHPEPEKGSEHPKLEPVTDVAQLKHSLANLDELITEFVHNPLFTNPSTRDAELFVKARRGLAQIIALSDHIKKNTEELSKGVKQSP